jgi:flavodoxin I
MAEIGIFFGTDSGTTRLMAKKMAKHLGEAASKPLNVNRIAVEDLLAYDALILGTPTYGEGLLPSATTGVKDGSWEEFLPLLCSHDLSGKLIALYGLGDQNKYGHRFANGMFELYSALKKAGATLVGAWSTAGYEFSDSKAVVDGKFVGLVIDQSNQGLRTDERITQWLEQVKDELLAEYV